MPFGHRYEKLSEIGQQCDSCRAEAAYIVNRVLSATSDEQVRAECIECLQILDETGARAAAGGRAGAVRGPEPSAQ